MSELALGENKKIAINNRGIFIIETSKLNPLSIVKLRSKFQTRILSLRANIQDLQIQINQKQNEIYTLEQKLKELSTPLVDSIIEKEKERLRQIYEKAQALLKETVGDLAYNILQEKGYFKFKANDGILYKVNKYGKIYRQTGKEWKQLCIIRPSNLPLPDFILSLFVNIRENPKKYPLRRR